MGKEIGIDLGTTNTVVSYVNNKGRLKQLRYESTEIIPSVIYFQNQSEYFIGEKAKKFLTENPNAGIANFKTKWVQMNVTKLRRKKVKLSKKDLEKLRNFF